MKSLELRLIELEERHIKLKKTLQIITNWDDLNADARREMGTNSVRDHYRCMAENALIEDRKSGT